MRSQDQPLRTFHQTSRPGTDVSPWDRREPGPVRFGQAWLREGEGEGNVDNEPDVQTICGPAPFQITPYHSGLRGWAASRRVRPAGCPGGNEVTRTDCE